MNGKIRIPLLEYQVGNVEDGASQVVLVVKNPLANAEVRDVGSIPGSGMTTHSSILAWRIPWTEDLTGYGPSGHKESDTTEAT